MLLFDVVKRWPSKLDVSHGAARNVRNVMRTLSPTAMEEPAVTTVPNGYYERKILSSLDGGRPDAPPFTTRLVTSTYAAQSVCVCASRAQHAHNDAPTDKQASVTKPRQHPTPREEGKANIIAATIALLETTPPQDLTIRDIASASGHHHRLIIEWFGSKGGLLHAVFEEVFRALIESGELFTGSVATRPEVRKVFGLFNYVQMHHPEFIFSMRSWLTLDAMEDRLKTVRNMSDEQARLVARQLAAHALGLALFASFLELSDDDVRAIEQWERQALVDRLPDTS